MSIHILPSEIWLKILKNCDVTDICQVERTCKFFNTVAHDDSLWLHACQQVFPNLEFSSTETTNFKHVYQQEIHQYRKLPGLWTYQSASAMVVTTNHAQLRGLYMEFYNSEEFGKPPTPLLMERLLMDWEPESHTWGSARAWWTDTWKEVTVTVKDGVLELGDKNSSILLPTQSDTLRPTPAPRHLRAVLPPGLFVEASYNSYKTLVMVEYLRDGKYFTIEKVTRQGSRSKETIQVSLTEVKNVSLSGYRQASPAHTSYVNDPVELNLTDKTIPLDFAKLAPTYRVALECIIDLSYSFPAAGCCLILHDDLFCVFFYKPNLGSLKLYYRVDSILSPDKI